MRVRCAADVRNTLGESCVWVERDQSFCWTDIDGRTVYRLDSRGKVAAFPLPGRCAFLFPRTRGGFLLGLERDIVLADDAFTVLETVAAIEADIPETRLNDAVIDPWGGVVCGTFNERGTKPLGGLYRLAPGGGVRRLLDKVAVANGLAFSPDGRVLYCADTAEGSIRRFRVREHVHLDETTPLAPPDVAPGRPDGAAVDSEGGYWNARVWGGCVVRLDPDGRVTHTVNLPVRAPTCVAFGGPDRRTLCITSLRKRHTEPELEKTPLAGSVFTVKTLFPGAPQPLCAL